ncbi:MAG TPA: hypothetical protein VF637_07725 [Sphingomicrobium sp.]|jgi:hypothetical protein
MNALAKIEPAQNVESYRASTDAAAICKDIVVATATVIQGRKYVNVEGWQAIAIAHGCAAGARDVEKVEGGVRAIGEIRRMSDGVVISVAEGFVGEDEETWYGGTNRYNKVLPKRADYAIRAMAQTRAISRACRSAFAHVVVMMNAGLATVPAEEVPIGGFDNVPNDGPPHVEHSQTAPARPKPAPLEGPIKTRAALRTACSEFVRELEACADEDMLSALLEAEKPLIDQVRTEHALFWNGDGADFLGMAGEIERRKKLIEMENA